MIPTEEIKQLRAFNNNSELKKNNVPKVIKSFKGE